MKKIVFSLVVVAMTAISAVSFYHSAYNREPVDVTTMTNIEALSSTESGYMYVSPVEYSWGWGCNCAGKGSKKCCG